MNQREIDLLAHQVGSTMRNELIRRDTKIAALEARMAALEDRPQLRWAGIWHPKAYGEGSLVTRSGSLWLALEDTVQQPGSQDSGWRLIVKRGDVDA